MLLVDTSCLSLVASGDAGFWGGALGIWCLSGQLFAEEAKESEGPLRRRLVGGASLGLIAAGRMFAALWCAIFHMVKPPLRRRCQVGT